MTTKPHHGKPHLEEQGMEMGEHYTTHHPRTMAKQVMRGPTRELVKPPRMLPLKTEPTKPSIDVFHAMDPFLRSNLIF